MRQKIILLCILTTIMFFTIDDVHAASLTRVSDLISTSAPSASSTHTIQFTATNAIPASGKMVITPESNYFNIPESFDYTDIDFAVATTGPTSFVDRHLAVVPSSTEDGVSVITGLSGSITITLNSSEGLSAGSIVKIEMGTNALFGVAGDQDIVNPVAIGSYRIDISTRDQSDIIIDRATAMMAIVGQVTSGPAIVIEIAPVRVNGLPAGVIAAGNDNIEISLNTNKAATCKYATTTDVVYASMTGVFSTTGATLHTVLLSDFQNGSSYSYYVRCIDVNNKVNTDDYAISFSLKPTPPTEEARGGGGAPYQQQGGIVGGSPRLFLSSVTLDGWSYPFSTLTILKDGEIVESVEARDDGSFEKTIGQLERGTYLFVVYAVDSKNRKSASFSSTMSLIQGTRNSISNIVISPSVVLEKDSIEVGDEVVVSGESVPGSAVELFINSQSDKFILDEAQKFTATTTQGVPGSPNGIWNIKFNSDLYAKGTYEVKARVIVSSQAKSDFSRVLFLGIGEDPNPDFLNRADINKDSKVNLVDFSILLAHWGSSDATSDINSDGDIDLADFSILLFHWTG